ncbi:MAG: TIGR03617 family F420-dependent LLM class oxidoreductase [Anaerolineales bacterium]|jgi:probable F420-dependent oxidoreductase
MKFDASIPPTSLIQIPALAQEAEAIGFDALWSSETQHSPFLPLALVAEHSKRLEFGTAVAIGFARSPTTLAHTAWDLAEVSGGRFILGLGTQVRAHVERRFSMPWPESPVGKLRELIGAIRAIWHTWQHGERVNYRGDYYKVTLMIPFFDPGPIKHPEIPIYIAGVNPGLCRLAGEAADGFHAHPYNSASYLRDVVQPAIAEGAKRVGRDANEVSVSVTAFVVVSPDESDFVRSQIAFYASTPTYRPVMAHHGWGDVADRLYSLSRQGAWGEMPGLISDEMLNTFAVVAPEAELAGALKERYQGVANRLTIYRPFFPGDSDGFWRSLATSMREG